jgi:hypothetical protein
MNRSDLHPYQNRAIEFIRDKKKCGLFLDMGLDFILLFKRREER